MLHHIVIGEGRPVLILHGVTLDHRHMAETFEPIFQTVPGWQRIYLDMPGHGQSPGDDAIKSQEDLLRAVINFATATFPGQPFTLIGESRGSYIARGFAYLRPDPVDGLCLIVPGGSPTAPPERLPRHQTFVADPDPRAELDESELEMFELPAMQNREIAERWRRAVVPALGLHDEDQEARVWAAFDLPFDLSGPDAVFAKPCLIVAGRQDSWSGYLDAIDCLPVFPRASLAVLDAAGHNLVWERPELLKPSRKTGSNGFSSPSRTAETEIRG